MLQNSTPSYRCSGCSAWVRTSSRRPLCTRPAAQIHSGFRGPAYRAAELLSRRRAHGEQQRAASLVYTKEELRRALRALGARASLRTGAYSPTRKSAGKGLDMRRRRRPAAHGSVGAVHTLAQPRTLESFQRGWEPLSACPSAQPATSGRAAPHRLLCASAASHPSTPTVALRRAHAQAHGARQQAFMRTVPPVGSVLLLAVSMRERVLPVRPGRRSVAPKRRALHPTSADAAPAVALLYAVMITKSLSRGK